MKLTKTQKLGLFAIPVLVGIYLIYRQFRPKNVPGKYIPPPNPKPPVSPTRTTTQTNSGCDYPLKKGVYNCDLVRQVQWALNNIPITSFATTSGVASARPLKEDGDFGPKTESVLIAFWGADETNPGQIVNQNEMDILLGYVVTDPAAFQAAENPYVMAPDPNTVPPTSTPGINPNTGQFDPFYYPQ